MFVITLTHKERSDAFMEARRQIIRKRHASSDPNLNERLSTLGLTLLHLAHDPTDSDLLERLPANVVAVE